MFLKLTKVKSEKTVVINSEFIKFIFAREGDVGGSVVYGLEFKHDVCESLDQIMTALKAKDVEGEPNFS